MENNSVLKLVCLGRMAGVWGKNPEFMDVPFLEGEPTLPDSWRGADMGIIVADAGEDGILDEVRKSIEAAREYGLLMMVMLLSAEPAAMEAAVLSIAEDKLADDREFCEIVHSTVQAIEGLISGPGLVNLDLEDMKAIFSTSGQVGFGYGEGTGEKACETAAQEALEQLENMFGAIKEAKGILLNVTGREDNLSMMEIMEVTEVVHDAAGADCDIIWGSSIDNSLEDGVRVMILTRS